MSNRSTYLVCSRKKSYKLLYGILTFERKKIELVGKLRRDITRFELQLFLSSSFVRTIYWRRAIFFLVDTHFFTLLSPSPSPCSPLRLRIGYVAIFILFNSFKLNLWRCRNMTGIFLLLFYFDQHLRMRENLLSTATICTKGKVIDFQVKKKILGVGYSSFSCWFFSSLHLQFITFCWSCNRHQKNLKPWNLCDNHLCFVRFHFSYLYFFLSLFFLEKHCFFSICERLLSD